MREDVTAMVKKYPLWNAYWEDKKPKLDRITIPMYALASYSTGLHTEGSLRGFLLSKSNEKWYIASVLLYILAKSSATFL